MINKDYRYRINKQQFAKYYPWYIRGVLGLASLVAMGYLYAVLIIYSY